MAALLLNGLLFLVAVFVTRPLCAQSRPMGGKFSDLIYSLGASEELKVARYI